MTTEIQNERKKRVVVIGGGTGTFTVLSGLKKYLDLDLTAIVTMADDGGSTGMLRDDFGVLPPGDLRQCLVALSEDDTSLRQLFDHRYDRGSLEGHSFGNIFISTLEQVMGGLKPALELLHQILRIRGRVIPVTLDNVTLMTELKSGKILKGEHALSSYQLLSRFGIKKMRLTPRPRAHRDALNAIRTADAVIIGPGNLYASLIPNLLVPGVVEALRKSEAEKIYVANIMNKHGHTDDFTIAHYLEVIEGHLGKDVIDTVFYNTHRPHRALLRRYIDEGDPVALGSGLALKGKILTGRDLLSSSLFVPHKKDKLRRTLIRHDSDKLAHALTTHLRKRT